ncbi:hypothetical protein ACFS4T_15070 [Pseudomonas lini]
MRKDRKSGFKGSDELDGMGSIKSRPLLGLDGTYNMGPIILGATFEHALEKKTMTITTPARPGTG